MKRARFFQEGQPKSRKEQDLRKKAIQGLDKEKSVHHLILYKIPADKSLCDIHQSACLLRRVEPPKGQESEICICCNRPHNHELFDLCASPEELGLGVRGPALTLLFTMAKAIFKMIFPLMIICLCFLVLNITFLRNADSEEYWGEMQIMVTTLAYIDEEYIWIEGCFLGVGGILVYYFWLISTKGIRDQALLVDMIDLTPPDYTVRISRLPQHYDPQHLLETLIHPYFKPQEVHRLTIAYNIYQNIEKTKVLNILKRQKTIIEENEDLNQDMFKNIDLEEIDQTDTPPTRQKVLKQASKQRGAFDIFQEICKKIEEIKAKGIEDPEHMQKSPYAYLTFNYTESAEKAIEVLHKRVYKGKKLKISKPGEAEDIIWENLGFSRFRVYFNMLKTYSIALLIILLSGIANYLIHYYHLHHEAESSSESTIFQTIMSELPSCMIIVMINVLLGHIIEKLTEKEMHKTGTEAAISIGFKTALSMFINSTIVPICLASGKDTFEKDGLVHEVFYTWIAITFMEPACEWLYLIIHNYIKKFVFLIRKSKMTQIEANNYFDPPDLGLPVKYSYYMFISLYTAVFIPLIPIGALFTLMGIVLNYWFDKYMSIRLCMRPRRMSSAIALFFIKGARLSVAFLLISTSATSMIFGTNHKEVPAYLCLFVFIAIMSLTIIAKCVGKLYKTKIIPDRMLAFVSYFDDETLLHQFKNLFQGIKYDIIRHGKDDYYYHNPVTRKNATIEYMEEKIKRGATEEEGNILDRVLTKMKEAKGELVDTFCNYLSGSDTFKSKESLPIDPLRVSCPSKVSLHRRGMQRPTVLDELHERRRQTVVNQKLPFTNQSFITDHKKDQYYKFQNEE